MAELPESFDVEIPVVLKWTFLAAFVGAIVFTEVVFVFIL
jgi:hypothetical protein